MRALVQRIGSGKVSVDSRLVSSVGRGLIVYLGVCEGDTDREAAKSAKKILNLRIFTDQDDKMNLSVQDIAGEILLISQFTLCADTHKGNRPSFNQAMDPEMANELFEQVYDELKSSGLTVKTGVFGAHMMIEYVNDGPVTIMLDTHR
jgi:D-tyrosyl-tRNA(Tyr) deacylase